MNAYDHMAMPYLPPNSNATTDDYLTTLPAMGISEQSFQTPTYKYPTTEEYRGTDPLVSSETDRPYNYPGYIFDPAAHQETQEHLAQESTSIDRDDELLSFQPTTYRFALLDYTLRRITIPLSARLHGMFFMADPPSAPGLFPQMSPPELTCYRRNLFQVTGSITLPRNLRYIVTERGERIPIVALELTVSATESVEGGTVKLISVPWKTPVNSPPVPPEDKTEKEPTVIPLDPLSQHDPDPEFATFPFAWKRLQFRIATANNGRRKELQQHFVTRLKLMATLSTNDRVAIAEARSAAIIVRGRSPRNFQQRKDLPVGERATGRKASLSAHAVRRTSSDPPKPTPTLKRERSPDNNPFASFDLSSIPAAQDMSSYGGWTRTNGGSNSAPAFPTPTFITPTLPSSKSPASASPPARTQRISHPHPDEPETKRARQGPSKSPRTSTSTHPSPQPPYKFSSLPPNLPSTTRSSSSGPPPTTVSEIVNPASDLYSYFPAVTQHWQHPFTTVASVNPIYSTPYLPHNPMIAASLPGGVANVLPNAVMK